MIKYVPDNPISSQTVLRFRILHVETGVEAVRVETEADATLRQTKNRTLCNAVFRTALAGLAAHLLEHHPRSSRQLWIHECTKGRKVAESVSLFGLRNEEMKQQCIDFLETL
jgi:hypothetical protein